MCFKENTNVKRIILPRRNDPIYKEIENFEEYELI